MPLIAAFEAGSRHGFNCLADGNLQLSCYHCYSEMPVCTRHTRAGGKALIWAFRKVLWGTERRQLWLVLLYLDTYNIHTHPHPHRHRGSHFALKLNRKAKAWGFSSQCPQLWGPPFFKLSSKTLSYSLSPPPWPWTLEGIMLISQPPGCQWETIVQPLCEARANSP